MKVALAGVWILTLAVAFGLGRSTAPPGMIIPPQTIAAFSEALEDEDLLTRTYRFAEFLQGLSPENLDEALAVFTKKRLGVSSGEVRVFMLAWARFDPEAAFEWATSWTTPWRTILEGGAIYAWGYRDPKGAVAALEKLDEPHQQELRQHLLKGWARGEDKRGVTDYVFSLPKGRQRLAFVNLVVGEVQKDGIDAVIEWAEAVPNDGPDFAKEIAFRSASAVVAQLDARRAAAWFEAHRESAYAPPAIKMIALKWVDHHDPPALFEWLAGLPDDETRRDGVRAGFTRWSKQSPEEAGSWLRSATLTAALDPAVAVFAREVSRSSPESAIEWAERIQDELLRRQTIAPILRIWGRQDPKAVQAWMADHDVPESVQKAIVNSPRYRIMEAKESAAKTPTP